MANMARLLPLLFSLIFYACDRRSAPLEDAHPVKESKPRAPLLGEETGDTVPTGIPISIKGRPIDPANAAAPEVVRSLNKPVAGPNLTYAQSAGAPRIIPVPGTLKIVAPGRKGVPEPRTTPAKPRIVTAVQPPPVPAAALTSRDGVIADILRLGSAQGLPGHTVRSMLEDSRGGIWFGTMNNGAIRYDPDRLTFVNYSAEGGLINNRIHLRMRDSRGNLWFSNGGHGAGRIAANHPNGSDDVQFTYYTTAEGLVSNRVGPILEDSRGHLWFGTDQGAACYRRSNEQGKTIGLQLAHFTAQDGLLDNTVTSLAEDNQQRIWITTPKGITVFPLPFADPDPAVTSCRPLFTLGPENGFKQTGVAAGIYQTWTNRLWWGTNEGLISLDLDEFSPSAEPPKVSLNTVAIAQTFIDYRRLADTAYRAGLTFGKDLAGKFDSVPGFYNYPFHLALPHHLNQLTFHFSAIDWMGHGAIRYCYLLEGFDQQWNPPTPENHAVYRNIPPGQYTFKVKATGPASAAGGWSEPFEYTFRILPPWWLAGPAYLIYGIWMILLLFLLYRFLLNRQLEHAEVKRLQELDAFKTRLYTNITHEFRTPLTIILGMARQIKDDPKKWYSEGLEMINRNGRQLLNLVNQMLDLSKLDQGKLELKLQRGEIIGFLHYLVQSFESYAAGKGIQLHFLKETDQLEMDFDPDQMTKVASNLFSNAIKYTPKGGQVYVTARRWSEAGDQTGETLEIRVKDTGIGIASEDLPRIFDRFYQVESRQWKGVGVGLALTKELVQLMGGQIQVQSKPGEGSDFSVTLPVSRTAPKTNIPPRSTPGPDKIDPAAIADAAVAPDSSGRDAKTAKAAYTEELPVILLIEDNRDVLTYLASCLEADYQLEFAANGREGVEQALEIVPDLIISDVMMPEKDGYEVCAILKENIRTSHIPVILLTAKGDRDAKLEGLRAGADAYLAKPFDKEELAIRLERLLELRRQLQARYGELNGAPEVEEASMSREELFVRDLRKTIEDNLSDESFSIAQLCRKLGLSRSQLHKKLKALTGKSTSFYIRAVRLEKAKKLLRNTDLHVSEVANEVGFRTPVYFTQVFTEEVGIPPSEFRKEDTTANPEQTV